jgi:superfamily II DNA/RNA helicase
VTVTRNDNKMDLLMDILNKDEVKKVLIFCETKMAVENLYRDLQQHGFDVESIHGDKTQMHRQIALKKFKSNEAWIMIGTDVASRGIDVGDITHVINYELPRTEEDYIHRIGRTGRGNKIGWALTFVKKY